jgi:hypothetical protein
VLFTKYYSGDQILRRLAEHVAPMGDNRGAYRTLVGGSEGNGPLGRPRRMWEDGIKLDV